MLELEKRAQGPSQKLEEVSVQIFEKVVPRLLRPLETAGNSIIPVLIHGDLWYGNCCTDNANDEPIVFDACSCWAHNECNNILHERLCGRLTRHIPDEVGTWRALRYRFGKKYIRAYHNHYPVSTPKDDHDD